MDQRSHLDEIFEDFKEKDRIAVEAVVRLREQTCLAQASVWQELKKVALGIKKLLGWQYASSSYDDSIRRIIDQDQCVLSLSPDCHRVVVAVKCSTGELLVLDPPEEYNRQIAALDFDKLNANTHLERLKYWQRNLQRDIQ